VFKKKHPSKEGNFVDGRRKNQRKKAMKGWGDQNSENGVFLCEKKGERTNFGGEGLSGKGEGRNTLPKVFTLGSK